MRLTLKQFVAALLTITLLVLPIRAVVAVSVSTGDDMKTHCMMQVSSPESVHAKHMPMEHPHHSEAADAVSGPVESHTADPAPQLACDCCDDCKGACKDCMNISAITLSDSAHDAVFNGEIVVNAVIDYAFTTHSPPLRPPSS